MIEAVGRGIDDIDAGLFTQSIEEAFARADELGRKHV